MAAERRYSSYSAARPTQTLADLVSGAAACGGAAASDGAMNGSADAATNIALTATSALSRDCIVDPPCEKEMAVTVSRKITCGDARARRSGPDLQQFDVEDQHALGTPGLSAVGE